jgi:hypothetical protein
MRLMSGALASSLSRRGGAGCALEPAGHAGHMAEGAAYLN